MAQDDSPTKAKAPKAKGGTEKVKKEKKVKDPNAPKVRTGHRSGRAVSDEIFPSWGPDASGPPPPPPPHHAKPKISE